ncbi:MAG: biotin--[Clostridia bacterium]|nr:biotin--[acetyl-CoA-carboxylase] ligase [Clostridia bacterium]
MLDREQIIANLTDKTVNVLVFDTVGSTNDVAKELCTGDDRQYLVLADKQSSGRGRQGKSFFSPEGSGLYFSLTVNTASPDFDFTGVTCAVSVAVTRAIEKLTDLQPKIKWVNDIYIADKKVCGILVQAVNDLNRITKLVIGVGVNITTADFPDELQKIAGSLNKKINRSILAAEIVNNIFELLQQKPDKYLGEYKQKSNVLGKEIIYTQNNTSHPATAVDIDENGGLVVEENGKKTTLTSGEISLRFPL